jgi:hypothetical protein
MSRRWRWTWSRIRSISARTPSSCMTLSLGWSLFNLPENGRGRLAFSFEKPKLVPQSDDFAVFYGIHSIHLALKANANEKRTN